MYRVEYHVSLPPAREGAKVRDIVAGDLKISMPASTTFCTMRIPEGTVINLYDDEQLVSQVKSSKQLNVQMISLLQAMNEKQEFVPVPYRYSVHGKENAAQIAARVRAAMRQPIK